MRQRIAFYFSVPRPIEWIVHTALIACAFIGVGLRDGFYFIVALVLYGVYNFLLRACCLTTLREVTSEIDSSVSLASFDMSMDDLGVRLCRIENALDTRPVDPSWLESLGFVCNGADYKLGPLFVVFHGSEGGSVSVDYWLATSDSWRYSSQLPADIAPRNRSEARSLFHRLDLPVKEEIVPSA